MEKEFFRIEICMKALIIICLIAVIGCIILLSCVPPVSRDALAHHLAVPKLYLKHGSIYQIPDIEFSYYPMNLDLLYLIPLYFGNDIIPNFIHFSFALFTAALIFNYLKKRSNILYALFGAGFFLSLPVIVKLSITAYVDLGLIFFSAASLLYLLKWAEQGFSLRFLFISAICCGLALGTKYNGLIVLFLLTLFVPMIVLKFHFSTPELKCNFSTPELKCNFSTPEDSKKSQIYFIYKSLGYAAVFFIVAMAVFSPWMIRNYIWTGNPLFPMYDNWFNPKTAAEIADAPVRISHFVQRSILYNESWWEILLIPIRIFFQGQDDSVKYFDGKLNPLLFFLPFFAFLPRKENRDTKIMTERKFLLAFAVLFLTFVFVRTDMRIRYAAPIIPPLVILSVLGLKEICTFLNTRYPATRGTLYKIITITAVCAVMSMNAVYISDQFGYVDPIPYISGKISRDSYIGKYRPEYPVVRFINSSLPENAKILCFFLGNRIYYSDREMISDTEPFRKMIKAAESPEKIMYSLKQKGITHFLIRYDLFKQWSGDNFESIEARTVLDDFLKNHLKLRCDKGGYGLFELEK